jgi:hypothetical protein
MYNEDQHLSESIAVIIPAHEAERWIVDCLDAISVQTHEIAEVVVIDDGSKDATSELVRAWSRAHPVPRLRLIRLAEPHGPSAARNVGWRGAEATWIAFCDADDLWHPTHLSVLASAARETRGHLICSDVVPFTDSPPAWQLHLTPIVRCIEEPTLALFRSNFIPQSAVLVRRECLEAVGGYDETRRLCEDYDVWARMAPTFNLVQVQQQTVGRRLHPAQASVKLLAGLHQASWPVREFLRHNRSPERSDAWGSAEADVAEHLLREAWRCRNHGIFSGTLEAVRHWTGAMDVVAMWSKRRPWYWPFRMVQGVYDCLPSGVKAAWQSIRFRNQPDV